MSHNHSVKESSGQIFGIAAFGAIVGAGIAMLFAPKSGMQARADLKNKVRSMKAKTQGYKSEISDAADNAEDIARQAKQTADNEIEKEAKARVSRAKKADTPK